MSIVRRIPKSMPLKYLVVVVLCGASFFAGTVYQKGQPEKRLSPEAALQKAREQNALKKQQQQDSKPASDPKGTHLGQVTGVGNNSITFSDTNSGKTLSFAISSATDIRVSGKSAPASALKADYKVVVFSKDGKTADRILAVPQPKRAQTGGAPLPND